MKERLSILMIAFLALTASADFDAEAWLAKRARLTKEALSLRAAYTNCAAAIEAPAEEVSVSIETFPDGSVKTSVEAKRAQFFLDTGLIWAEGVVLTKFDRDGSTNACIEAENCVINRESKSGWAEGRTKVTQGKSVFSGRRVFFSSPERYVKVFCDTDMESQDLKAGGLRQ